MLLNRSPGFESGRLRMISHVHRINIGSQRVLFHAVFDEKAVFALGDVVGFNMTRGDSDANESSSWSFATGMNCDGILIRSSRIDAPGQQAPAVSQAKN